MNGKIKFYGVSSLPGAHDLWLHLISGEDGSLFLSLKKKKKKVSLVKEKNQVYCPSNLLIKLPSNQIAVHNPLNV